MKRLTLSDTQRLALTNLSRKQDGDDVDFINIADARALTELGLATRTQQGWIITPLGTSLLAGENDPASPEGGASVTRLTPKAT